MSTWQLRDTAAAVGSPKNALHPYPSFELLMGQIIPEARSGETDMHRYLVTAPTGATKAQIRELEGFGIRIKAD